MTSNQQDLITVLDPTAEGGVADATRAQRLRHLSNDVNSPSQIALLWNGKKNGDVVLRGVVAGLRQQGARIETTWHEKLMAEPLSDGRLANIAKVSEAAILALSD